MGRLIFIAVLMVVVAIANFASSEVATGHSDPGVLKERSEDVQQMSPEEIQNHETELKAIYANVQHYREVCYSSGALDRFWQHMQKKLNDHSEYAMNVESLHKEVNLTLLQKMNKVTQPAI
ncbi:uncharacterized protein LOC129871381 [Solanum dulcamara]|uniref:uncharacterized protein LOC129871381 n=1 Tax=Solanum dulcamara TaxID=45834 RepID=UPI002486CC10|nr:uncharacterized protein LOC129871381 [Solanum dulcamara]